MMMMKHKAGPEWRRRRCCSPESVSVKKLSHYSRAPFENVLRPSNPMGRGLERFITTLPFFV